jgi:hypothetical protein
MPNLVHIPPNPQLQPLDLVAPGFRGLNLDQAGALLNPQWATEALNAVVDGVGRLAARNGFTNQTTTPIAASPSVKTIFEHKTGAGTVTDIIAWNGGISTSFANPSGSDISGAVTDANGTWLFQNFNDKCIGFQAGVKPIVRTVGNFAHIVEAAGTAPQGGIGLAAYGRIWGVDTDLQTIKYSSLLDETTWSGGSSGTIDMRNVWTAGTDSVTAIAAFNGSLVVFGKRHIIFWQDSSGNKLGLDPVNMKVTDVITGTGCLSQWSVQAVGDTDLLYLSPTGVQSLQRLVVQRSNPIVSLTKYVRSEMVAQVSAESATAIRSTYNPAEGFYLLSFPNSMYVWVLDQKKRYRDEDGDEVSIITRWNTVLTAMHSRIDNNLYVARTGGKVGRYTGANDDGTAFRFKYQSPWLDLGEQLSHRIKLLKRLAAVLFVRNTTQVLFKWGVDFSDDVKTYTSSVTGSTQSEWGSGEWGLAEWAGGLALRFLRVPARGRGQYYRIAIEADTTGQFAVQQAELFTKIGRLT